jgi:hypothetical protein
MRCSPANIKSKDMATKQEKEVAKQKAIKGGMPSDVADKVFRMQMGKDKSGIDSSHSFPMKQAYTIRMSPLLQTENEEGLPQNVTSEQAIGQTGALGTLETTTNTEVIPGGQETKKRLSYDEAWEQNLEGIQGMYKDKAAYIADRMAQKKADPTAYELDLVTKTGVAGGPGVITIDKPDETVTTQTQKFTPTPAQVEGLTPVGQRKDIRRGRILSRNIGKISISVGDKSKEIGLYGPDSENADIGQKHNAEVLFVNQNFELSPMQIVCRRLILLRLVLRCPRFLDVFHQRWDINQH